MRIRMVRLDSGHYTTLKGTARSFAVQNWLRSEGEDELVPPDETAIDCDKTLCTYRHNGYTLKMVKKPDQDGVLNAACAQASDVLIAWRYLDEKQCPGAANRIGRGELEKFGAYAIWLDKGGIRIVPTRTNNGRRIWQAQVKTGADEEW